MYKLQGWTISKGAGFGLTPLEGDKIAFFAASKIRFENFMALKKRTMQPIEKNLRMYPLIITQSKQM